MMKLFYPALLTLCALTCGVLAKAQNSMLVPADVRSITILSPLEGTLDLLEDLQIVRLRQNTGNAPERYGVIAQEVAKHFPQAVTIQNGQASVDYAQLTAITLGVAKELKQQNQHLGAQFEHLMSEKADLERKVYELQAQFTELSAQVRAQQLGADKREQKAAARN